MRTHRRAEDVEGQRGSLTIADLADTSGQIQAISGLPVTYSIAGETPTYEADGITLIYNNVLDPITEAKFDYTESKAGDYGTLYLDTANGNYLYIPDQAKVNALAEGETNTDSFTFTANITTRPSGSQPFDSSNLEMPLGLRPRPTHAMVLV